MNKRIAMKVRKNLYRYTISQRMAAYRRLASPERWRSMQRGTRLLAAHRRDWRDYRAALMAKRGEV